MQNSQYANLWDGHIKFYVHNLIVIFKRVC